MRATRVALSCEWTSFTTSDVGSAGMSDSYTDRTGIDRAMHPAGNAARAADDSFRRRLRLNVVVVGIGSSSQDSVGAPIA